MPGSPSLRWLIGAVIIALAAAFVAGAGNARAEKVTPGTAETAQPAVVFIGVSGPIGPATARYLKTGLEEAERRGANALVLELDTPGGLDTSMREMIQDILAAPVPVVVHVTPRGARAASAGTFLLYASHIAAMAPATSVGAATPVALGGPGAPPDDEELSSVDKKAMNDAVAFIRGLAELRERNVEFAERAVTDAATMSSREALAEGVIDVIAEDRDALLAALDGRTIDVRGGERVLAFEDAAHVELTPDWQTRLLGLLSNPNVAYLLLILGFYGLLFELSSPGAVLPGVAGSVALLLALYSLHVLPVSVAGAGLLLLGIGLMIAEAVTPSFGALGAGGMVAFVVGSVLLIDVDAPGFELSRWLVAAVAVTSAGFFFLVLRMAFRSRRRPVVTGREQLIGMSGVAAAAFADKGLVRVRGETWNATTDAPLAAGESVTVVGIRGLVLEVRPQQEHAGRLEAGAGAQPQGVPS